MRQRAEIRDGVIFFDVSDSDLEGQNKFIPYLLFSKSRYSIGVSSSGRFAPKISLGSNPWNYDAVDQKPGVYRGTIWRRWSSARRGHLV